MSPTLGGFAALEGAGAAGAVCLVEAVGAFLVPVRVVGLLDLVEDDDGQPDGDHAKHHDLDPAPVSHAHTLRTPCARAIGTVRSAAGAGSKAAY